MIKVLEHKLTPLKSENKNTKLHVQVAMCTIITPLSEEKAKNNKKEIVIPSVLDELAAEYGLLNGTL